MRGPRSLCAPTPTPPSTAPPVPAPGLACVSEQSSISCFPPLSVHHKYLLRDNVSSRARGVATRCPPFSADCISRGPSDRDHTALGTRSAAAFPDGASFGGCGCSPRCLDCLVSIWAISGMTVGTRVHGDGPEMRLSIRQDDGCFHQDGAMGKRRGLMKRSAIAPPPPVDRTSQKPLRRSAPGAAGRRGPVKYTKQPS